MSKPIIVLKFGSSVLCDESALPIAVSEIYREVRQDRRVIAVVSAFGVTTDTLLQDARRLCEQPDPHGVARLLETGEARSAATLGLALAEVGLAAEILDAPGIGLRTTGPVLDAEPSALDTDRLRAILDRVPVVVVPGFCGRDAENRTTLLGRGGSDLTALFLAQQLDAAECRLLKDVDGLLRVNSDGSLDHATRYTVAHYDECLRVGGPLIQPKAVEFAARHRLPFSIARCGSAGGTLAGPLPSRFETIPARPPRLKVALAGLGTVGLGVLRWLRSLSAEFEVTGILVGDVTTRRAVDVPRGLLRSRWQDLLAENPDLVIEVIGGTDTAAELIGAARRRGIAVVTANKQLLALDADLKQEAVGSAGGWLKASASVGGGLPILEHAGLIAADEPVTVVSGVLNGTCNFILDRIQAGATYGAAVAEAQKLGLAETDPHLDVSGLDSVYKLALLATRAFDVPVAPEEIFREGLDGLTASRLQEAGEQGLVLKVVAEARLSGGRVEARVEVRALAPDHPLAACRREDNCLLIETASGRVHRIDGKGAGRWPTTCSVIADALEWRRETLTPAATRFARQQQRSGS